jgi:hypothetical protein
LPNAYQVFLKAALQLLDSIPQIHTDFQDYNTLTLPQIVSRTPTQTEEVAQTPHRNENFNPRSQAHMILQA